MDQPHVQEDLDESQEVKEILRDIDRFRLHSNVPQPSSPLTDHCSSSIDRPTTTIRSASHQSLVDDFHQEEDQNSLDQWSRRSAGDDGDSTEKHLYLQGARHFLDADLFAPASAAIHDIDTARKMIELLQEAHLEREKTRRWAEKMRGAVETWARVRMNVHTTTIQILEDQLTEALQECRRQEEKIENLEALVAELKSQSNHVVSSPTTVSSAANPLATSFQTPITEPKAQHIRETAQSIPPPTVSPSSPLSDGSATNGSSAFYDRRQAARKVSDEPKAQHRKRRIQKSGFEVIEYPNGSTREIYTDHEVIRHHNQDVEITYPDHCRYYYAESKTLRITDSETTIYYYSNKQSEIHWTDGRKLIRFPDGTLHGEIMEHSIAATV